jgi:pimeloyl-ACP methyl ester carboxylesterase
LFRKVLLLSQPALEMFSSEYIRICWSQALTRSSLGRIAAPVLIVRGEADCIAPPATNADYVRAALPPSELVSLPSVGHYTFLSDCTDDGRRALPTFCADLPGVSRQAIHEQVSEAVRAFFDRTLADHR